MILLDHPLRPGHHVLLRIHYIPSPVDYISSVLRMDAYYGWKELTAIRYYATSRGQPLGTNILPSDLMVSGICTSDTL